MTRFLDLEVVGPLGSDPHVVNRVKSYLNTTDLGELPETIQPPELLALIEGVRSATLTYGAEKLGIDLAGRVTPASKFHFFDAQGWDAIRSRYGLRRGSEAVHSTSGHILASQGINIVATLGNALHEVFHIASFRSVRPTRKDGIITTPRAREGFKVESGRRSFDMIDEALTEISTIDTIWTSWAQQPQLAGLDLHQIYNFGYIDELFVMEEVVGRLSAVQAGQPEAVWRELQIGKFTGDMKPLALLRDAFGTDGLRRLARWRPGESRQVAESLGLDGAVGKIDHYHMGKEVGLLENLGIEQLTCQPFQPVLRAVAADRTPRSGDVSPSLG